MQIPEIPVAHTDGVRLPPVSGRHQCLSINPFLKNQKLKPQNNAIFVFKSQTACYLKFNQGGAINLDELMYLEHKFVFFFKKVNNFRLKL